MKEQEVRAELRGESISSLCPYCTAKLRAVANGHFEALEHCRHFKEAAVEGRTAIITFHDKTRVSDRH